MSTIERIGKAIPPEPSLSTKERAAVLEIAFLAVASDHEINEDEVLALRAVARALGAAPDADVDALLARFEGRVDREEADAHLRKVAGELATPGAREAAYRAAYAVSISDLATTDEEFEFDLELIDALGLTQDDADRLMGEVVAALQPS
jgi:hypothetical protein